MARKFPKVETLASSTLLNRKELLNFASVCSLTFCVWQNQSIEALARPADEDASDRPLFSRAFETVAPSVTTVGITIDNKFEGIASGIVWDRLGHVVTAYYPVKASLEGSPTIQVAVSENETRFPANISLHPATTVAVEPSLGLMILKIDPSALASRHPPLKLVRSPKTELKVGQDLLLIGSTRTGSRTCCVGCLSAIGRSLSAPNGRIVDGLIQSDVKLESPLGFGGPLITNTGLLVGMPTITTWTKDPSKTSSGINFAVPSDVLAEAVPKLIKYGNLSGRM